MNQTGAAAAGPGVQMTCVHAWSSHDLVSGPKKGLQRWAMIGGAESPDLLQ